MIRWLNPRNGDLSALAVVVTLCAAALCGWACWARMAAAGADSLQFGAAVMGAMAPIAWALAPVAIFKNGAERSGYIALCVGISAVALAFLLFPEVFA